jgi:hypothetical protein
MTCTYDICGKCKKDENYTTAYSISRTPITPQLYLCFLSGYALKGVYHEQWWAKFQLSDPPKPTPNLRLYRPTFLRILEVTQSLHRFKLSDFETIQSLHRL